MDGILVECHGASRCNILANCIIKTRRFLIKAGVTKMIQIIINYFQSRANHAGPVRTHQQLTSVAYLGRQPYVILIGKKIHIKIKWHLINQIHKASSKTDVCIGLQNHDAMIFNGSQPLLRVILGAIISYIDPVVLIKIFKNTIHLIPNKPHSIECGHHHSRSN